MQRNWDLIRDILLKVENSQGFGNWVHPGSLPDHDADQVSYHIGLLVESGYCNGTKASDYELIRQFTATSLTWEGHELLDKIRSESVWNKTKSTAIEKGVDLSVEVVKSIASRVIERVLFGN